MGMKHLFCWSGRQPVAIRDLPRGHMAKNIERPLRAEMGPWPKTSALELRGTEICQ